jgi:hypothetical protein
MRKILLTILFGLALPLVCSARIVGYWKLDGNSTDSSGRGNNGTDTAMTYVNAKNGQGGVFDGSVNHAIQIVTTTGYPLGATAMTITSLVKLNAAGTGQGRTYFSYGTTNQGRVLQVSDTTGRGRYLAIN